MGEASSTFKITGNTDWSISVPTTSWLTVSPLSGTGDATITCFASAAPYRERRKANIFVTPTTGTRAAVAITDSLPNTAPMATGAALYPTDGQTDVNDTFLRLSWEPSKDTEDDKLYYNIELSTDGSKWNAVASYLEVNNLALSGTMLTVGSKYYWRVTTIDMFGKKSAVSKTFTFTTSKSPNGWSDGEVRLFQSCCNASATDPFTVIVTGDGFTQTDFGAGGAWDKVSTQAIMSLNNIEPYKTWGKYLRIIRIAAVSSQSGISSKNSAGVMNTVLTKFNSMYDNFDASAYCGLSTTEDGYKIFDYVLAQAKEAGFNITKNYAVLVIQNVSHYNGTVNYFTEEPNRTLGFVCLCPGNYGTLTGFENVVCHEIGGHAIGHFADLYSRAGVTLSAEKVQGTKEMQAMGWYQNVSVVNDKTQCPWSQFFTAAEYSTYYTKVGLYEGARSANYGIWRPESDATCMDDNRFHYDAPSRYSIIKELKECAGETLTWKDFVSKDYDRENSTFSLSRNFTSSGKVPMLPEPIIRRR